MQELRSETIGDRRVGLVAQGGDYYAVTIAVRGPAGWEDIAGGVERPWRLGRRDW